MKSLKNLLASALIGGSLLFNPIQNVYSQNNLEKNVVKTEQIISKKSEGTKHALIFIVSEFSEKKGTAYHPIDENSLLYHGVRVYNALREYGVRNEDIYFMYPYEDANFSDSLIYPISKEAKEKFNKGGENNENLATGLRSFYNKLNEVALNRFDPKDTLIIYLQGHACQKGLFWPDVKGCSPLQAHHIPISLRQNIFDNEEKIINELNNEILIVGDMCYSNKFIENSISLETYPNSITFFGSSKDVAGWIDRDFNFGSLFFEALVNKENDLNNDGVVCWDEAFEIASKKYKKIGKSKEEFISGEYLDSAKLKFSNEKYYQRFVDICKEINWKTYSVKINQLNE